MIYAILGAVFVGVSLGVFGSGGSILTVPILKYLLHHHDKTVIAESLAIVGAIALIIAIPYAKAKLVEWRVAMIFGVPAMAGTFVGAWLSAFVGGYVQLLVFAGVMLLAAIMMWRSSTAVSSAEDAPRRRLSILLVAIEGLAIGALTGFVGVGGGFLIVPALVLLAGLPMRNAVATSLIIITLKSAVGLAEYIRVLDNLDLSVDWTIIGLFVFLGTLGSMLGKQLNTRINQFVLKRGFAVFLVLMSIFILIREGTPLLNALS